ncbi:fungal fucose-specific lectin-domain-containing protein [Podospora aff. communis PSN243]|uniref:Fungal fucose-specific lectin-domain-containing protein n=1 Tax=Podospora aff. communis PSN243 TaxID=3040156 RepID=A0AAV9GXR8_9PEZI|nr:fungal fucose-specific lectin-domain-containing protein [Podospora aff. communis PSN243]
MHTLLVHLLLVPAWFAPLAIAVPFGNWQFNPETSLAAWSGFVKNSDASKHWNKCNSDDPSDYKYVPHAYFQDTTGNIREALYQNAAWEEGNGGNPVAWAVPNSPIAVTNWWEGSDAKPVILVFFLDVDGLLYEKRYDTGSGWRSGPRPLGRTVGFTPDKPGSLSVTRLGNEIFLIYQTPALNGQATVAVCRYFWASNAVCKSEFESWGGALPGTSTTVFADDAGNPHIYYQSAASPYPIMEQYWDGSRWNTGTMKNAAMPQTQIAAIINRMGKTTPYSGYGAHFFANNDQIYNYLTWSWYDSGPACSGWCPPRITGWVKKYDAAIAVTGCNRQMRSYFITNEGKLGEAQGVDWGENPNMAPGGGSPYWGTWWWAGNTNVLGK